MSAYKITRARKLLPVPASWNGFAQTSPALDGIHGVHLSEYWQFNKDGMYTAVYRQEEWDRCAKIVTERLIQDDSYLPELLARQNEQGEKLVALSDSIRATATSIESVDQLYSLYRDLRNEWIMYDTLSVYPWYLGAEGLNEHLVSELTGIGLTADEIIALSTPSALTFSAEEELAATALALKQLQGASEEEIAAGIKDLAARYFWISFGYDGPVINDQDHYRSMISDLAAKGKPALAHRIEEINAITQDGERVRSEVLKRHEISQQVQNVIELARQLPLEADIRKRHTYQAHIAFSCIADQLTKLLKMERSLMNYLTLEELQSGVVASELAARAEGRRLRWYVMRFSNGEMESIDGAAAAALSAEMIPKDVEITSELRGTPGSKGMGVVQGAARILVSASQAHELQEGEILIAPMTTPEFVPAMRKAAAIVTDEGGITCHAAIVARELKKACVVGTKAATKVFKTGDMIEVDAERGIVRKL